MPTGSSTHSSNDEQTDHASIITTDSMLRECTRSPPVVGRAQVVHVRTNSSRQASIFDGRSEGRSEGRSDVASSDGTPSVARGPQPHRIEEESPPNTPTQRTPSSTQPLLANEGEEHDITEVNNAEQAHNREARGQDEGNEKNPVPVATERDNISPSGGVLIDCPVQGDVSKRSFAQFFILFLGVVSLTGSTTYVAAAFLRPNWEPLLNRTGMTLETATMLCALFAKVIETAFVTVFVTFIGQHLSHRALVQTRGVSISDLTIRNWILQPGLLFTKFINVKYSGLSFLGITTLLATLGAMFYTTAADALVSPKLNMPDLKETHLKGLVETSFANPTYLKKNCITPEASRTSCLQLQMLGQSYHHYQEWLSSWFGASAKNNYSTKLAERPPPTALWLDNTTVTGWWLDDGDSKMKTRAFGRMINNVTYAFPHTGVFAATKNGRNKIHRPDVDGATGALEVIASVSSPILNTLCVGASAKDLEPLIVDQFPQNRTNFNVREFAVQPSNEATLEAAKNNKTALDSVFEWDNEWNPRPIFGKYPPPKTNVINFANVPASTIHIVFPVPEESRTVDNNFTICALKAGLQGGCSTRYHEESSGGDLRANCSSDNKYAYKKSNWSDLGFGDSNFASLSISWAEALTLGQGIYAGAVVSPVDLTNFVPDVDETTKALTIPSHRPTVAEVLGVMAGAVLLGGSQNATFGHKRVTQYLNDTEDPTYETFKALTRASLLQSGGPRQGWQKLFFLVLFIVCVMSLLTCLYLAFQLLGRHITDFTETQNIFTLAVNSPPTSRLAGACGTGPTHAQLGQPWLIDMHEGTNHYFLRPLEKEATITPQGPLISRSTTAYFSVPNEDRSIASSGRPESLNEYRAIVKKADKKPFWSYLDPLRLYRKADHRRSAAKALSGGKE